MFVVIQNFLTISYHCQACSSAKAAEIDIAVKKLNSHTLPSVHDLEYSAPDNKKLPTMTEDFVTLKGVATDSVLEDAQVVNVCIQRVKDIV